MLHPTNKVTYPLAQRMADVIQNPVELVIERKNKSPEPNTIKGGDSNSEEKKDFTIIFYPHKNKND